MPLLPFTSKTRPCFHPSAKECTGERHGEAQARRLERWLRTRRSPSSTRATWAWSCPRRVLSLGASSSTLCAPRSSWPASMRLLSQVVTTGSEPQHTPAPGYRLCGRPARGSVETKVAQPSANWRSGGYSQRQLTPRPASSSAQPRPVSCLGRARRPHRASSQYRHEAGEVVDSRTLWGRLLC